MPTRIELEAEIRRLNEALAMAESREGTSSQDMGVAGRVAITRLRDTDYPELIAAVEQIPGIYANEGYMAALGYCRTTIRSLVDAIILSAPRTADLVRTQHRIHMMLSEGEADLMMRTDEPGQRARMEFLEVVERYALAPSYQAAFRHGVETPAGIMGISPNQE
jgi:hypothetical protein